MLRNMAVQTFDPKQPGQCQEANCQPIQHNLHVMEVQRFIPTEGTAVALN